MSIASLFVSEATVAMKRPLPRYGLGLLLGFLSAISITGGMFLVFIPAVIVVCIVLAAMRSTEAFGGALVAFGLTWVVLIGSTYMRCQAMGPDCVSSGGEVAFVAIGGLLMVGGLALTGTLLFESKRSSR